MDLLYFVIYVYTLVIMSTKTLHSSSSYTLPTFHCSGKSTQGFNVRAYIANAITNNLLLGGRKFNRSNLSPSIHISTSMKLCTMNTS